MTRSEIDALLARHQQSFASRSAATLTADHIFDFTGALVTAGVLKVKPL